MDNEGFIKKLRLFLADPDEKIWSNSDLGSFIEAGIRQYSIDSGFFLQKFSFCPDRNGKYSFPEDHGRYLIGWNTQGTEITPSNSSTLLRDFYGNMKRTGVVRFIYGDLTPSGKYMLYPAAKDNQHAEFGEFTSVFGEIEDDAFGVSPDGWGVTSDVVQYDFIGDAVCLRIAAEHEIKDHMPIIYYAMYKAYNTDSDHANAELAKNALSKYRMRIAAYDSVKKKINGLLDTVKYY